MTYTVNYSDANFQASTLSTANVHLNATGNSTGTLSFDNSSGTTRVVTISNISGTGTLGISIDAGSASDKAGNLAPAVGPSAVFPTSNAVLYVNSAAAGAGTGLSWTDAFSDLQAALNLAQSGDQIWVAHGTYAPTSGTDQTISFALKNGVAVYGGFVGTETLLSQRDWVGHPTTLSGAIGAGNSLHVVTANGVASTTILDGFTITAGDASGNNRTGEGGGFFNDTNSSPTLANLTFINNSAGYEGGGLYNYYGDSPTLTNVSFINNSAGSGGGGLAGYNSSPTLTNVTFIGNTAYDGGGVFFYIGTMTLTNVVFSHNSGSFGGGMMQTQASSNPILTNVTFSDNSALAGGAMYADAGATFVNCILWGDTAAYGSTYGPEIYLSGNCSVTYSDVQGGLPGTGNVDSDPLFADAAHDNLRLHSASPAIDTATNTGAPTFDLDNLPRPFNGSGLASAITDMGAYEYQSPSNLSYGANPVVYAKGTPIPANTPSSIGGAITTYAITPGLPAGLTLDTSSGAITGTPTVLSPTTSYSVTATNSAGSTMTSISITVIDVPPSSLSYGTNPAVYTKGTTILANTPSSAGGSVVSYGISPALPAGLNFNTSTGAITGTPTALSASASYTVTATNSGGSTTASVSITVNDVPPSSLSYSTNPAVYTKGTTIAANTPTSSGGPIVSYSISSALSAGLQFDTTTGAITGTPTALSFSASYTITATNSGGSTTAGVSITVNDVPPSSLSYSTNSVVYTKGTTIAANTPTSSGGPVVSYGIAPALPAGLNFNTSTGAITGTPTALAAAASYTVTATNSGGSTTASLSITVKDVPPSSLSYGTNPAVYTKGTAITANTPTSSGGAVVSYGISPALPAGLNFITSTGAITGTPTAMSTAASYTVTATNSGGSTTASISITVNDVPPSSLSYGTNPAVYTKGTAITANSPTSSGAPVVSYGISPALPAGLNFNTSTGDITGTPTALSTAASYTVTATNSGGSTTASVSITVNDVPPSSLSYGTNPAVFTKGTTITADTPTSSGGPVVSYGISPALPAGLNFNTSTGAITGTPTAPAAAASYTVTATNSGGSTTASLSITVKDVPPSSLSYGTNPAVYTKGTTITANSPTSSGGPVVSYGISPALPAGLNFNTSTGAITGTPTALSTAASYTVTATNSGGSTTASLSITVKDVPPSSLSYSTNPAVYLKGTAITANSPSSAGGAVVSYAIAPALPAGLSFDTVTGVITGSPTTKSPATSYTVTATNSGGSTAVNLSLAVNDSSLAKSIVSMAPSIIPAGGTATITLTTNDASGNPVTTGGLTVAFALGSTSPGGTIGAVTDNQNGTYTATFTAGTIVAGSNTISATIDGLAVTSTPAAYTVPNAPTGTVTTLSPTFLWTAVFGATNQYEVYVSDLTTGTVIDKTVGATTWVPPTPLVSGDPYRWWFRALNVGGSVGAWSSPMDFTVTAPVLLAPLATVNTVQPLFT